MDKKFVIEMHEKSVSREKTEHFYGFLIIYLRQFLGPRKYSKNFKAK